METRQGAYPAGAERREAAATQWVKPGLIGRVKHLRGEEKLRHASLQDFRAESCILFKKALHALDRVPSVDST